MAVAGGTLFATLAGSGAATTALLGRILVPDMVKRGYKQPMTLGPVMGSGGLAVMLPPSALGVILAATANLSVGEFLLVHHRAWPDDGSCPTRSTSWCAASCSRTSRRSTAAAQNAAEEEAARHRRLCVSARHHHLRRHRPDLSRHRHADRIRGPRRAVGPDHGQALRQARLADAAGMPGIDAAHLDHGPDDPVGIERLRAASRLHRRLGRPGRSRDVDQPQSR